jgi:acyl-CoA synthetase (NDP forming)
MRSLTLVESKRMMEKYRIPFAKSGLAKDAESAAVIANNIGYPVVLKIISPSLIHKSDASGIDVGISGDDQLRKAFHRMYARAKKNYAHDLQGILVQKMVEGGQEILIGGKKDDQFGHFVAFGLGGIFVEVIEDVSFRLVPIKKKDAREMMEETRGFKILKGFRGKKYDTASIEDVLMKVSKMLSENKRIVELDINPLIVDESGCLAVDARVSME